MVVTTAAPSPARVARREQIAEAARALVGCKVAPDFDPFRNDICAIDVVMVAGSPWLKDGMERDFTRDESGYRKIGGSANTPRQHYFFRSSTNLTHYLKRAGFYIPRGAQPGPVPGMACFLDWDDDRGRYNFQPDRMGIVLDVRKGRVTRVVLAEQAADETFTVSVVVVGQASNIDRALIGYSDLP
jgi:hypothetical protein